MGTDVTVLVPAEAGGAVDAVRTLFDEWDRTFSRFRSDSELALVNRRAGASVTVGRLFLEVLTAALDAARATDGLFDPALERRMVALGYDRTFEELPGRGWDGWSGDTSRTTAGGGPDDPPAGGPHDAAPPAPGGAWRAIDIDHERGTVRLPPGVGLDFGGIAKGMAVDAAVAELVRLGATPCAVDAGGDLAVAGSPPGAAAWTIAIELPVGRRGVQLPWGALATSSVARRRWRQADSEHHHLLDPRTGRPAASGVWSVSVAAGSCRQAEVAAKVALLLGREAGPAFLERHGLSGLLVLTDGTQQPVGTWRRDGATA